MDPFNMNNMFGPWEDEIEEDENQRKLRKEYKYWRGQNFRMTAQCNIMIRQIKEMEAELATREAQKAQDLTTNERFENIARIAQNEFFEIAKQTMEEAAKVHQRLDEQNGQTTAFDKAQIDILNRLMAQQEKHMRMAIVLEDALSPDTERRKRWESLKEKERKVIETETEIAKKEVILAQIKKENEELKKQKAKRKNWMLKEIEAMDAKIKEQQALKERRETALKEFDELQAELRFLRAEPDLNRTASSDGLNIDDDLPPPVVFKNPNDFPILRELFHKPSSKSQKEKEKRAKKIQQKAKALKRVKSSSNMHGATRPEKNDKIIDVITKEQEAKSQKEVVIEKASTCAAITPEAPKVVEQPKIFKEPAPPAKIVKESPVPPKVVKDSPPPEKACKESPPPVPMEVEESPQAPKEVPQKKTSSKKPKLPLPLPSPVKTRSKASKKAKQEDSKKDDDKKSQSSSSKSQEKKSQTEEASQKPQEKKPRPEEVPKPQEKKSCPEEVPKPQEKKSRPEEVPKPQEKKIRIQEPPKKPEEKKSEGAPKSNSTPKEANETASKESVGFDFDDADNLFDMSSRMSPTPSDLDLFGDGGNNSFGSGNVGDGGFPGFEINFDDNDPFGSGNNAEGNADSFFFN